MSIFVIISLNEVNSLNITCQVNEISENFDFFECEIANNLEIHRKNIIIDSISEEIDERFTKFVAYNNTINYLPINIHEFFTNLTHLAIIKSNLQQISQSDFKNLQKLTHLWLPFNKIEIIEWNLFSHNQKLIEIILTDNRLRIIHTNAFDNLQQLEHLDLIANECVDSFATSKNDVNELIKKIGEMCKYQCECENYFVIALAIIAILCIFVVIYVVLR